MIGTSITINTKPFTLLVIDGLATVSSDASSFASVVEGLNVILGQTILSLGVNASAIITGLNLISNIEGTLIYVVNVLVPTELAIVVLTDETGRINVSISP